MSCARLALTVIAIPTTAAAITAVASQPMARRGPLMTSLPITFLLPVIIIMMAMTGTATTPLMTALQ